MSMSTSVYAIKPPDQKWKEMKAAWDACKKAKVDPPEEVWQFFEDEEPNDAGVRIDIEDSENYGDVLEIDNKEGQEIYRVSIDDLPEDAKYIEFVHSY